MELEKMLETALERILAVMNLEFGGIYIADPEKRQIELFAYRGVSENYARSVHSISVDEDTIRRLTISAQRGKLIPSFSMMLKNLKTMKKVLSAMKKEGLNPKYTTNVILQCKDKIQGALVVGSKRAQPLDESGQKLIISIAQQLSAAISNTQLLAESRKEISSRIEVENALRIQQKLLINAQKELKYFTQRMLAIKEEEKKKLSSYLHDEIGAMSISLNAYLPITEQHVANRDCTSAFKAMKDNQAAIKRAISRLRKAMVDLWPPDLEILGLPDALRSYISELEKQTNLRVYYTSRLGRHVPADDMAIVIYRIVQESLNNIIKHADAKMAQVQLGRQDSNVRLTIRDDGKGFDVAKHACEMKKTIGLRAMREMTESLEGNFCIESRPGRGTKIEVVFPLKGPEK
jgi:signal transduction histidine kinase